MVIDRSVPLAPVVVGLSALICGCSPAPAPAQQPATAAPAALGVEVAAGLIAQARCEHEVACNEVGPGQRYPTREVCTDEFVRAARADLAARPCPAGLEARSVAACSRLLRAESCHPLSTLTRMVSCRPAGLCATSSPEAVSTGDIYGE